MSIHIPIREWQPYIIAIIVVLSISSTSLASQLQNNVTWGVKFLQFLMVHLALMSGTILLGVIFIGIPSFAPTMVSEKGWLFLVGIGLGYLAVKANKMILRYQGTPSLVITRQIDGSDPRQHIVKLLLLTATAILEETLFRGYLVMICFLLPNKALVGLALLLSILCFAITHIYGELGEVIGKIPLGTLCLLSVLYSHLLLPAIVAHIYFNLMTTSEPLVGRIQSQFWKRRRVR